MRVSLTVACAALCGQESATVHDTTLVGCADQLKRKGWDDHISRVRLDPGTIALVCPACQS